MNDPPQTPQTISLDGNWRLESFASDEAAARRNGPIDSLAATVPGDVHLDLLRAGAIEDPWWRLNSENCQWVAERYWVYSRTFDMTADALDAPWELVFEGLDTYATVELNGTELGRAANMHRVWRFEARGALRPGRNELTIRFTPPETARADRDASLFPAAFDQGRVFDRKMQSGFGWDWAPRLVTIGIWRGARLEALARARIEDVFARTTTINGETATIEVDVDLSAETPPEAEVAIEIADAEGAVVATATGPAGAHHTHTVTIDRPRLWWPNGWGEQHLYSVTVRLVVDGDELDSATRRIGVRTIELDETPDQRGTRCIVVVNGRPCFMKGSNWVPLDSIPAALRPERYRETLRLTRDAHVNMLRVWGGGIYEPPAFYDACDELGILIWQDFMFACAHYPLGDAEWQANAKVELRQAFRRLRNHTSIAIWCGNNECGMELASDAEFEGKELFTEFLRELCESDRTRPYRVTSPLGGSDPNSPDDGDMHFGAWVECARARVPEQFSRYVTERCDGRFHSEIHTMGAPPLRSLRRFMTDADIADDCGPVWEWHTRTNPGDGCAQTYIGRMDSFARAYYGEPNVRRTMPAMLAYQHHEIITQHAEHHRRRMFDCAGMLTWSMNECWPGVCGAMIDYFLAQKAGWFAARRGFAPVLTSIERTKDGGARIWVCSDRLEAMDATIEFAAVSMTGERRLERRAAHTIAPGAAAVVFEVGASELTALNPADWLLTARILDGERVIDRALKPLGLPSAWALPEARLSVESRRVDRSTVELTVSTDAFARVVTIEPEGDLPTAPTDPSRVIEARDPIELDDCYFDLLPGETRTVRARLHAPDRVDTLVVRAWNAEPVSLKLDGCA